MKVASLLAYSARPAGLSALLQSYPRRMPTAGPKLLAVGDSASAASVTIALLGSWHEGSER